MKIKFDSDDNLPLNKVLKFHVLTIIIRIDISEGIDINKSSHKSKECHICHYWYLKTF